MSKTKKGSNATFTGPQQGLTVIGNHCYAYSGEVQVANSFVNLLKFTTPEVLCVVKFNRMYMEDEPAGDDYTWRVYLNGNVIYQTLMYSNAGNAGQAIGSGITLIIPPLTEVIVDVKNVSDGSTNNVGASIVGEVYG